MKRFRILLLASTCLVAVSEPLPFNGFDKPPVWVKAFGYRWVANREGRKDPVRKIGNVEVIVAADWDLEDRGIRGGGLAGWQRLGVIYLNDTADRRGFVANELASTVPIVIQNYPGTPTSGELVWLYAKKVGTKKLSGGGANVSAVLWDYGIPVEAPSETTPEKAETSDVELEAKRAREKKAAEARFAGVKTRAEGGSTNAMLELAKMYRSGTGTETNDFEARVWEIRAGK